VKQLFSEKEEKKGVAVKFEPRTSWLEFLYHCTILWLRQSIHNFSIHKTEHFAIAYARRQLWGADWVNISENVRIYIPLQYL